MADRFFSNELPDFVFESDNAAVDASGSSLLRILSLPYPKAAETFLHAGLDLKNKVVEETWVRSGRRVKDFTLYTGALGTAFLLFKSYQVTGSQSDLALSSEIIRACDEVSKDSRQVTFICGRAGVCSLGAVVAKHSGDEALLQHYVSSFKEIEVPRGAPSELLYGRAGYLWACSFLNKNIDEGTVPSDHMVAVAKDVIAEGKKLSGRGRSSCPLLYEWHGTKYWGAAHGLAGIMHVLMDVSLKPEDQQCVKGTLQSMIQRRFHSGNYPSSEGKDTDRLVHWCHGAPGVALTLSKAYEVFHEQQFLQAASDAAEVVWNRGLLKRVGICHGVSGNAYVFLNLFRLTGNMEYLYRAKAFACFLVDRAAQLIADGSMHSGDRPFSLFEGQAGMAFLLLDMVKPSESRFPGYEL